MATQKQMLRFVKRQIKEHSGDGEVGAFWTMLEKFWPEEEKKTTARLRKEAQRERERVLNRLL